MASLNVCGLLSKLHIPEFCDFIRQHDILFLMETKMGDNDVIDLPDRYGIKMKKIE